MTTHVDAGLGASERVLAQAKVTDWVLVWPCLWTAISFGLLIWLTTPWLIYALVFRRNTQLLVTDGRLIHKRGAKRAELGLATIDQVRAEQTPVGRMFDYGTIVVTSPDLSERRFRSLGGLLAVKRAIEAELALAPQRGVSA
jgi:hypothetical protein